MQPLIVLAMLGLLVELTACSSGSTQDSRDAAGVSGEDGSTASADTGGPGPTDAGPADAATKRDGGTLVDAGAGRDSGPDAGPAADDIPGGGTLLFQEKFDDANFAARGWYDSTGGAISKAEHAPGSSSSFQCAFAQGATGCTGGTPARHKIEKTESVYLSFYLKFSANWVGSGQPYHPHMLHFVTDADGEYVGYANTHLTTYTEVVWDGTSGTAALALQDTLNVDPSCILQNDDSFVGCNGSFSTYRFSEDRSVCACNGLAGDLDQRDCFSIGSGMWYSARAWRSAGAFTDAAGSSSKTDWHFVEVYFRMNSIQNGVGVADGKIRWVQDGKTLIKHDHVLLRTGSHAALKFAQHAIAPYIGVGSPIAQTFWLDDLTVATARP